jgi:hypothetical protein
VGLSSACFCWKAGGHEPWRERHAAEAFYTVLEDELRADESNVAPQT